MSVEGNTFPKSVQPGIPKLGSTPKGWKRYRIGDLFDVVSRPTDLHDDQEYDLVTVKRSRGGIERRSHLLGRQISVKSQFILEEGDFLISKRQIVHGACAVVPAEFSGSIVSNEYSVLRPRPVLSLNYLRYLVHSIYLQQTFFHSSVGVHVEKMIFRLEDWFKWPIHLPPVAEQEKLGRGLMGADAKITLLSDKKTALEDYKRGLMQRLFSRELRFTRDDGSAFPDWEERELCKAATINPESAGLPREFEYINLECVNSGVIGLTQRLSRTEAPSRAQRVLRKQDVLFQLVRPYQRNNLIFQRAGDYVASTGYAQIRAKSEPSYLFQVMHTDAFVREVMRRSTGTGYPAITPSDLGKIKIPFPHSDEQHKIAAALSALDTKIDALSQKISEMEAFKKGLLQKLFV